jgi:rhodanese-related sulfurtransferase
VLAADALEKAGYTNVKHFVDGIAGWQNAGYSFEEGNS